MFLNPSASDLSLESSTCIERHYNRLNLFEEPFLRTAILDYDKPIMVTTNLTRETDARLFALDSCDASER